MVWHRPHTQVANTLYIIVFNAGWYRKWKDFYSKNVESKNVCQPSLSFKDNLTFPTSRGILTCFFCDLTLVSDGKVS